MGPFGQLRRLEAKDASPKAASEEVAREATALLAVGVEKPKITVGVAHGFGSSVPLMVCELRR